MRILFLCAASLLSGIYMACYIPDLIPMAFLFVACYVLFVSCFFTKRARLPLCMVLCFVTGALYLHCAGDLSRRPMQAYVNEYVTITADCIEKPQIKDNGNAVVTAQIYSLSFLDKPDIELRERVQLHIKAKETLPCFGESFTAVCRIYEPAKNLNGGGFDYNLYLRSKRIFYAGSVENGTIEITGTFRLSPLQWMYALQQRSAQKLAGQTPRDEATVMQAVALGDKSYMTENLTERLQASGLSHMTAVSGMHVSTLISAVYMLLSVFRRNKYRYSWLVAILIVFFMLFTGMSPSVVRASVMGLLVLGGYALYRAADPLTSLAAAAGIIVIFNPYAAFDMGFMLSFTSTLGILLFDRPLYGAALRIFRLTDLQTRGRPARFLAGLLAVISVTVSAQLLTLPVASWMYGYTSCWSIITNILATPLAAVILIGGILVSLLNCISPMLSTPVLWFCYPFVRIFLKIVEIFGDLRQNLATVKAFSPFALYVYGVFLYALFKGLKQQYKKMGTAAVSGVLLICIAVFGVHMSHDVAKVTFVNVGQGDCTLLQLPNHITVLVDGGGTAEFKKSDFDIGKRVIMPYLRKEGIRKINYMIATHPHDDHVKGLESLLELLPVEQVVVPVEFDEAEAGKRFIQKVQAQKVPIRTVQCDDVLTFSSDCFLHALMPDVDWLRYTADENELSLVMRFVFGQTQVVLTGDLGEEGEAHLAERKPVRGYTTIYKAAHHGSASSNSAVLLDWLQPQYVCISCGENSFGHPAKSTLDRFNERGITVYRTDEQKDVTFILGKKGIHAIQTGDGLYDEN